MSLKKFCSHAGCREIVDMGQKYCNKHQKEFEAKQREHQKNYDTNIRYKRDKQYHDFYNSSEWERLKLALKNKYKGLCLWSYYIDHKIIMADMYHHIIPIKDDWSQRLKENNIIPLSNGIHNMITDLYLTDKKMDTQVQLINLINKWNEEFK